jgi:hypothetical protein
MVNREGGQLFTIEGIAAGLLMILTAYLVVSATSVYTAGDTHISDMQLEQIGSDTLKIMDTPENRTTQSDLQMIFSKPIIDGGKFKTNFLALANNTTVKANDHINFTASYSCRKQDGSIVSVPFSHSQNLSGGEHAVRVTKWVIVNKDINDCHLPVGQTDRAVLVEVLMWRD